jgi:hypothetical protein
MIIKPIILSLHVLLCARLMGEDVHFSDEKTGVNFNLPEGWKPGIETFTGKNRIVSYEDALCTLIVEYSTKPLALDANRFGPQGYATGTELKGLDATLKIIKYGGEDENHLKHYHILVGAPDQGGSVILEFVIIGDGERDAQKALDCLTGSLRTIPLTKPPK